MNGLQLYFIRFLPPLHIESLRGKGRKGKGLDCYTLGRQMRWENLQMDSYVPFSINYKRLLISNSFIVSGFKLKL